MTTPNSFPSLVRNISSRLESIGAVRLYVLALTLALILASYNLGSLQEQVRALRAGSGQVAPTLAGNTVPPSTGPVNVSVGHFPLRGSPSAKVTVIEFGDFRCPFCAKFYQDIESSLIKDYVNTGKVKYAFRNNPILGQESEWTAQASECANEQGKFWEYHDYLYSHQAAESDLAYYSKDNLIKYAGEVGLDKIQFASCLSSAKYAEKVSRDKTEAQSAGVTGTPTSFINGQKISGAPPYASFKSSVDALLAK